MFGYIHVNLPKKLSPEVWQIPLKTPCINKKHKILEIQTFVTEIYRVSQEECARLRESVPYVKLYRYNPKHLCSK